MPVYVDNAQNQVGRYKLCHMLADTPEELRAMARKISLPRSAKLQHEGRENEHLDISMTYRDKAIKEGAIEVDSRALVRLIRRKRHERAAQAEAAENPKKTLPGLRSYPKGLEPKKLGGVTLTTKDADEHSHKAAFDDDAQDADYPDEASE